MQQIREPVGRNPWGVGSKDPIIGVTQDDQKTQMFPFQFLTIAKL